MNAKVKIIYEVECLEVLADKGYYYAEDLEKCKKENTIVYVSKPNYSNGIGDSIYFSDKFKYDKDIYTCPGGQILTLKTKKVDAKIKTYSNIEGCNNCINRDKCTKSKNGKVKKRENSSEYIDEMIQRVKENQY